IAQDRPSQAVEFEKLGEDARRAVPTPDHYWPLLYVLGARLPGDVASFAPDHIEHGSLSMTSVTLAAA
ncbi:MAG: 4,5-DOPA dioxygenase extradiol, partial [Caulobacter sp.]